MFYFLSLVLLLHSGIKGTKHKFVTIQFRAKVTTFYQKAVFLNYWQGFFKRPWLVIVKSFN